MQFYLFITITTLLIRVRSKYYLIDLHSSISSSTYSTENIGGTTGLRGSRDSNKLRTPGTSYSPGTPDSRITPGSSLTSGSTSTTRSPGSPNPELTQSTRESTVMNPRTGEDYAIILDIGDMCRHVRCAPDESKRRRKRDSEDYPDENMEDYNDEDNDEDSEDYPVEETEDETEDDTEDYDDNDYLESNENISVEAQAKKSAENSSSRSGVMFHKNYNILNSQLKLKISKKYVAFNYISNHNLRINGFKFINKYLSQGFELLQLLQETVIKTF